MNANGSTNGVADTLQDEVSLGYRPVQPLEAMWLGGVGDMPNVTLRRDLEFMQMHPIVASALEYYKSGTSGAEFWGGPIQENPDDELGKPISPEPRVSQFVLALAERFWQRGVPLLQEGGYPYGWGPGEHVYKESNGMLVWSHLKGFHPNDASILTVNHQSVGIRVRNIRDIPFPQEGQKLPRGGHVDLWFANEQIPAKAAWYPHRPRFNQYYGRSQLISAWRPWRRLAWRDGVEQVVDAAIYRAGYCGPIVKHPPGETAGTNQTGIPATRVDAGGQIRRNNRDIGRQMIEWAKAGAGFTIPSDQYPQAQGGGPKWDIIFPEHVMDVNPLIVSAEHLEEHIYLGIGVPPELVKAGGTGSGYSGRSIPREAFLDGQQRVADAMLQIFVEQVIKPLVLWNFGDIPFNIQCKPLLKTQTANKAGQPQPPLPQPPDGPQQPGMEPQAAQTPDTQQNSVQKPPQQGPAFSLDDDTRERRNNLLIKLFLKGMVA